MLVTSAFSKIKEKRIKKKKKGMYLHDLWVLQLANDRSMIEIA